MLVEKSSAFLPNCKHYDLIIMTGLTRYAHWYNSIMNLMAINSFLIGFKIAPQERTHTWYYKHVATEVLCPKGECNTVILLNGHRIKLPSKYLALYP